VVQDSTAILDYLDERYPLPPLMPADAAEADAARAWEESLDEEVGVTLRLWFYHHTLARRDLALAFLTGGAPWWGGPVLSVIFPKLRSMMRSRMGIHAESAARSMERMLAAFDRLDEALASRPFLVGERFSRADLTACALLAPFCAPGRNEEELAAAFPSEVIAFRDRQKTRPYFAWVDRTYRQYRHPGRTAASAA
jgi:glutathione S-transferase